MSFRPHVRETVTHPLIRHVSISLTSTSQAVTTDWGNARRLCVNSPQNTTFSCRPARANDRTQSPAPTHTAVSENTVVREICLVTIMVFLWFLPRRGLLYRPCPAAEAVWMAGGWYQSDRQYAWSVS